MLIEQIELRHIKIELINPFKTSMGIETHEEHIIVRIDSEGLTGWGECVVEPSPSYSYETTKTAWHILEDFLIPSILNNNISSINSEVVKWNWIRGHRMAKAALEAALWDLFSKQKNISLSKMLGGSRKKIEVGVSIGIQSSPKVLLKKIDEYINEGYKRIKIKIAPGKDINFIKAVRKEFPNILFQVDANSAYNLDDIDLFKKMNEYNLLLIEQPLGYEDIYQHSKLQKQIKTPICLDESIHSLDDAIAAVELDACNIINIKPGRVGGFIESQKIHNYCKSKNIPVWHGGMLETGIGRAGNIALASLPNFLLPGDISASKRYFKQDIVEPEFKINSDGTMNVPTTAGIGVEVLIKELEKITVHKKEFKN